MKPQMLVDPPILATRAMTRDSRDTWQLTPIWSIHTEVGE